MHQPESETALLIFVVGAVVVLAMLIKAAAERTGVPAVVGFIGLGLGVGWIDGSASILTPAAEEGLNFLAHAGVVALLFRVAMESDLGALTRQLPKASLGWLGSVLPSGILGYLAVRWLGYPVVPALFVATALTATSIGVAVAAWEELGALRSDKGALLLDIAELDDLSGVMLMALLIALVPAIHAGGEGLAGELARVGLELALELVLLGALCLVFARFVERRLTAWFIRLEPEPAPMLLVAGIGFVIAALAGWLGFSLAIGAFFAGLAFSIDPARLQIDEAFRALSEFFGPFFFVGIGLAVDLGAIVPAIGLGLVLLAAGAVGKVLGTSVTIARMVGWPDALLIGVSMVPRAEIAMIIMAHGQALGPDVVPEPLFGAVVFVSIASCLAAPPVMRILLRRSAPHGG